MSKDDGGPFYPSPVNMTIKGISRRDWLVGMAVQGFLSQPNLKPLTKQELAIHAYEMADAIIERSNS